MGQAVMEAQERLNQIREREGLNLTTSARRTTSEATSQKSHGQTRETKTCDKHGEYESELLPGIYNKINLEWTGCPQCKAEYDKRREEIREAQRKEEEDRKQREKHERMERWIRDQSGIPKRFMEKGLDVLSSKSVKQKAVHKAARAYLDAILNGSCACLIMCGMPGTGKTHISCAMVLQVIRSFKRAVYISTSQLMRRVKSTWGKNAGESEEEVMDFYCGLSFLVIDEVGVQFGTETEKLIFYEIINRRYENMLPTVLISNLTADELKDFIGERAFDRFREDGGAVLAFDWESYRK